MSIVWIYSKIPTSAYSSKTFSSLLNFYFPLLLRLLLPFSIFLLFSFFQFFFQILVGPIQLQIPGSFSKNNVMILDATKCQRKKFWKSAPNWTKVSLQLQIQNCHLVKNPEGLVFQLQTCQTETLPHLLGKNGRMISKQKVNRFIHKFPYKLGSGSQAV